MSMANSFLGGAQDRLLPASIPFRFFLSASVFHALAWAVLLLGADEVAQFRGGPGLTLAAIHLVTLGVLAMTAIGASFQLLPVVTRRPMAHDWPTRLCFWLMLPGVGVMALGMGVTGTVLMQTGAVLVCCGLLVFVVMTADNLRRASSIPVVSAHGWMALVALILLATMGVLLILDFEFGFLADHAAMGLAHMMLASFGFMGFLVLGLSLVLIPMFALSRSLPHRPGWAKVSLTALALAGMSWAVFFNNKALLWISLATGVGAAGCYLWLMHVALRSRMRKRLGLSFILIRASWAFLILALALCTLWIADIGIPNAPVLTGFVILFGWLLTFLTGVLQRIMPFLASMHVAGKSGLPPLLSDLAPDGPLKIHMICHFAAIVLCAAGIFLDQALLIQIGAGFGVFGAIAFLGFASSVALKLGNQK
jgi:hypothetical protein